MTTETNASETAAPAAEAPKAAPKTIVTLTDAALAEINRLREKKGLDEIVLRVGVKGGGCAGLSYTLNMDDAEVKPTDHLLDYENVKLVVDRKSALFLRGMQLNYSDDLIGGGFKFENPNAKKSCACGSSFSA